MVNPPNLQPVHASVLAAKNIYLLRFLGYADYSLVRDSKFANLDCDRLCNTPYRDWWMGRVLAIRAYIPKASPVIA